MSNTAVQRYSACLKSDLCFAMQPGVASVHASVLQKTADSVSFYLRDMPALHGMSYGDIRRRFSTAIVTGTYGADRMPHLNPDDSDEYKPGEKLIFLANKGELPSAS